MEECKIINLYSLDETIAKPLLLKYTYPWEVLAHIEEFILEIGKCLPKDTVAIANSIESALLDVVVDRVVFDN